MIPQEAAKLAQNYEVRNRRKIFRVGFASLFSVSFAVLPCVSFAFLFIVSFALLPIRATAAQFAIETDRSSVAPGSELTAEVRINTEGESLNAFEGELLFPKGLFGVAHVHDGSSIVTVWLERPQLSGNERIRFSGITPGGFRGEHGFLFSVVFQAKEEGAGLFVLQNISALKNDGSATPAVISVVAPHITVSRKTQYSSSTKMSDVTPPEPFTLEIAQNPDAFSGKKVLVFLTQDKQSGVAYYEVCEGLFAPCVRSESPYVLKRQNADALIKVKAYDQSGNIRTAHLSTVRALIRYSLYGIFGILVMILSFYRFVRVKRRI